MPTSRRLSLIVRALRCTLCALALPPLLIAGPARAGWLGADSTYAVYRIPAHHWSRWTVGLDGTASHGSTATPGILSNQNSQLGSLGTSATWGYDSDPLFHYVAFSGSVSGARTQSRSDFSVPPRSDEYLSRSKSLGERATLDAGIRWYPFPLPVALTASTFQVLDLSQFFQSDKRDYLDASFHSLSLASEDRGMRNYNASVGVGTGLGRVRDATPVYQAQVLEDRLRGTGAIARSLSPEARRRLAALFTVQEELGFTHQRPDKYFWREIERVLREDDALAGDSLDAWDVLRVLEPIAIARSVLLRRTGWFVGPSIAVITARRRTTLEESRSVVMTDNGTVTFAEEFSTKRTVNERSDGVATLLSAAFHRPLDPRWQVDLGSTVQLSEAGEILTLSSLASSSHMLADRWLATLSLGHQLMAPGRVLERRPESWAVSLVGELHYFLEDSWALSLTALEIQSHNPTLFRRQGSVRFGVRYLIAGLFAAPGLVEPMRPSQPTP